jgi:hypothetical protein
MLLSPVSAMGADDRTPFLREAREAIVYWSLFFIAGFGLAVLALLFGRFGVLAQRASLAGFVLVGLAVGSVSEWWTSLYFFVPAILLFMAHRRAAHA